MFVSVVVPLFKGPRDLAELLESLSLQTDKEFETIIIVDGSKRPSSEIVDKFSGLLDIKCVSKENPEAAGDFIIFLDSDCRLPDDYLAKVKKTIEIENPDAFSGPEKAAEDFSPIQKAINYAIATVSTTRENFPRPFNMVVRKSCFEQVGGFSGMASGNDKDLSYRIVEKGFKTIVANDVWVWHRRRTNLHGFYRQSFDSGVARVNLGRLHPWSFKFAHALPSCFLLAVIALIVACVVFVVCNNTPGVLISFAPAVLFSALVFIDSARKTKDIRTAELSIFATFTMLSGYGAGFLLALIKRNINTLSI